VSDFDDLVAALEPVVSALRRLGVAHYVGGSVASTLHGAIRSTMDVDLVCVLEERQVEAFLAACGTDYYVSSTAACDAVRQRKCFNLIHLPTSYKIDVFVHRGRRFDDSALARARPAPFGPAATEPIPVATVEDSILAKLEWFRLTDETSERQWDDVSKLVRLHGIALDVAYLREMADTIGVGDLLERLLSDGGSAGDHHSK
jgi:hypothetical protein